MRNKYLWIGAAVALFVFPYAGCKYAQHGHVIKRMPNELEAA